MIKQIKYNGCDFVIQAYVKNNFANICEINGDFFQIDFVTGEITTAGKENKDWIDKKSKMIISDLKQIIESQFKFKYCQRQIEGKSKCNLQCSHCQEYYKPLEVNYKNER